MATFDGIGALARAVQGAVSGSLTVPLEHLDRLFAALFFASLRTEEQKPIRFAIAYVDPDNPDPKRPRVAMPHDRALVRFDSRIEATAANLAKLAQAVDPHEAWMAVHSDAHGNPFVWALVDQMIHSTRFEQHGYGSQRPIGAFTATVVAPGFVRADHLRGPIAVLNREAFTVGFSNVFLEGPVSRVLARYAETAAGAVKGKFKPDIWARLTADYSSIGVTPEGVVEFDWLETFVHVISLVQDGGHGGAVLLVPDAATSDLRVSYRLPYERLADSFVSRLEARGRERLGLPPAGGIRSAEVEVTLREAEVEGAVRFVAGMTRVDGALVIDRHLRAIGFGAEITSAADPVRVLRARTASPSAADLVPVEPTTFGTRHRSMFRYCAAHPGSLGIVVSADGDLRVVTTVDGDLIFWENVATRLSDMTPTMMDVR